MPDPGSAQAIGWLILTLAGLIAALNQGARFIERFRTKPPLVPQPLEVRGAVRYATEDALNEVERRLRAETDKLHGRISGMRDELTDQMRELAKTVDEKLDSASDRIDALPGRMIALLNETKELHSRTTR
jgi:hypothetical protein